jgi:hypothetical protein
MSSGSGPPAQTQEDECISSEANLSRSKGTMSEGEEGQMKLYIVGCKVKT